MADRVVRWWRAVVHPNGLLGRVRAHMMLLLVAGLLVVDCVAYLGLRSIQSREVDTTLNQVTERVRSLPPNAPPARVTLLDVLSPSDLYVAWIGPDGAVLTSSDPVSTDDVPDLEAQPRAEALEPGVISNATASGGTEYALLRARVPEHVVLEVQIGESTARVSDVVVGYPLAAKQQAVRRLVLIEIICALAVLGIWFALSTGLLRATLRPLREIARTADAIAKGHTNERIPIADEFTELRHVSEALNEAFDARQQSEDRMREFVADASHELRTPLASVRGWTDLYREGGVDDWDGVDVAMQSIWQEAGRMSVLVEDMLTLARIDAGPRAAVATPVPLAALLAELVAAVARLHPEHHYEVAVVKSRCVVMADQSLLRRALSNLLMNAGAHTPAGTRVMVSVIEAARIVAIRVEDDGPGMTEAERESAFDRFWRGDRSRGRPGGTGLGLAISRSILRAAGGDLRLDASAAGGLAAVALLRVHR